MMPPGLLVLVLRRQAINAQQVIDIDPFIIDFERQPGIENISAAQHTIEQFAIRGLRCSGTES